VGLCLLLGLSLLLAACGGAAGGSSGGGVTGEIAIEGSSTVYPITTRVSDEFSGENPDVDISVGDAGTSEGFEAFCKGDTDISDASRPIEAEEIQACKDKGIEYIELPIGLDGISVVVNQQNDFAKDITLDELNKLWEPDSNVSTWKQIRSEWPDQPIELYGPGTESGTFDFFTETVTGEEGASRTDYNASGDDNQLVQGVGGDPNALGYFGYSYYAENTDTLNALKIDGVAVNPNTIISGEYPLSRPLFIYVSTDAVKKNKAVVPFVNYYIEPSALTNFVEDSDYVAFPKSTENKVQQRWEDHTTGTIYNKNGTLPGGDIESALQQSQ
jgi:phosphate transport system substrate-binding protein